MVLLKCARKYQILSHKSRTHIHTAWFIHARKSTNTLAFSANALICLFATLQPLPPTLTPTLSITHLISHTNFQIGCAFLFWIFWHRIEHQESFCSLPCIRKHYFVFCWLFGDLFIAYGWTQYAHWIDNSCWLFNDSNNRLILLCFYKSKNKEKQKKFVRFTQKGTLYDSSSPIARSVALSVSVQIALTVFLDRCTRLNCSKPLLWYTSTCK